MIKHVFCGKAFTFSFQVSRWRPYNKGFELSVLSVPFKFTFVLVPLLLNLFTEKRKEGCTLVRFPHDFLEDLLNELQSSRETVNRDFQVLIENTAPSRGNKCSFPPPHRIPQAEINKTNPTFTTVNAWQDENSIRSPGQGDSSMFEGPEAKLFGFESRRDLETVRTFLREMGLYYLSPSVSYGWQIHGLFLLIPLVFGFSLKNHFQFSHGFCRIHSIFVHSKGYFQDKYFALVTSQYNQNSF